MTNESQPSSGPPHTAAELAADLAPTLALLRAVAAEGHVTRAAERLGIPQPTVSRAVARLSEQTGTALVARQGRGIELTRPGRLLASAAEDALRTLESGCRSVLEELDPERGQVVFGFQHTMGRSLVPTLVSSFRAQHPQVRFTLIQGARDAMLGRMLDGEIDVGMLSPLPDSDHRVDTVELRHEPLLAVVFIAHPLARRAALRLTELAGEDFIATRHGFGLRQLFADLTAQAGFTPRLAFESEEVDTVRGLVAAGLGVALLPPADAGPVQGTVEIPLRPAAHRTIGIAWPARRPLPPAARSFRDFALAHRDS